MTFHDDNHVYATGVVLGHLLRHGVEALPGVDDNGNYTDTIQLKIDMGMDEPSFVEIAVLP